MISRLLQSGLYHAGERHLDQVGELPDFVVRREGLKQISKRALQAIVLAAVLVEAVEVTGDAIDRSPTFVKFRQEQEAER